MDILIGILALVAGIALCLIGLRLFFILLPVAGFVAGVFAGAGLVSWIFGDRFLATTLGIVVGLVIGVIFAAFAWLYWYIGVLLAAGSTGAALGAGLLAAFGVDSGWLLFIIGAIGAALFIFGALALNYPIYLVIVATALQGAALAVAGLLLILNRINRHDLASATVWEKINDNWILWVLWVVAAGVGLGSQLQLARSFILPARRWEKATPA